MSLSKLGPLGSHDGDHNDHNGPPFPHGPGRRREADLQKALALLSPDQLSHWHELTGPRFAGLEETQRMRTHDGPRDKPQAN